MEFREPFFYFSNLHYLSNWCSFGNKDFSIFQNYITHQTDVILGTTKLFCITFNTDGILGTISFYFSNLHYLPNWCSFGNKDFFIFQNCITHQADGILGTKLFYILSARGTRALIHLAFYLSSGLFLVGPFPQFCVIHY